MSPPIFFGKKEGKGTGYFFCSFLHLHGRPRRRRVDSKPNAAHTILCHALSRYGACLFTLLLNPSISHSVIGSST